MHTDERTKKVKITKPYSISKKLPSYTNHSKLSPVVKFREYFPTIGKFEQTERKFHTNTTRNWQLIALHILNTSIATTRRLRRTSLDQIYDIATRENGKKRNRVKIQATGHVLRNLFHFSSFLRRISLGSFSTWMTHAHS